MLKGDKKMQFRRVPKSKLLKIALALTSCGVALCVAYICVAVVIGVNPFEESPFDNNPFDDATFERAVWIKDSTCVTLGSRRAGMAEDLLQHILKRGMQRREIVDLLGSPEFERDHAGMEKHPDRFQTEERRASRVLVYYLGEELGGERRGHQIDRAWLDLRFDAADHYAGGELFLP